MLQLTNLSTGHGHRCTGHGLSGRLRRATLAALLGVNGCGKSTLLRTVAGLLPPFPQPEGPAGEVPIRLYGRPLTDFAPRDLARTVSIVLTERPVAEGLTVRDVVETGRIPYSTLLSRFSAEDVRFVERALERTGTTHLAHRPLRSLSDGERQRVFVAKALAQDTPVILLDEPSAFLDFPSKIELFRLLRRLAHEEGKAILMSTHDVEPALQLADQLWLLRPDALHCGSAGELAEAGLIGRFFDKDGLRFDAAQRRFVYAATEAADEAH